MGHVENRSLPIVDIVVRASASVRVQATFALNLVLVGGVVDDDEKDYEDDALPSDADTEAAAAAVVADRKAVAVEAEVVEGRTWRWGNLRCPWRKKEKWE